MRCVVLTELRCRSAKIGSLRFDEQFTNFYDYPACRRIAAPTGTVNARAPPLARRIRGPALGGPGSGAGREGFENRRGPPSGRGAWSYNVLTTRAFMPTFTVLGFGFCSLVLAGCDETSATGCSKDADWKGDRICDNGRCVAAGAGSDAASGGSLVGTWPNVR
jgi:hypothetical protein